MNAIEASHYEQVREALATDSIVQSMAVDVGRAILSNELPFSHFFHDDGTPRHEFMLQANRRYNQKGGTIRDRHIGAVAEAIHWLLAILTVEAADEGNSR